MSGVSLPVTRNTGRGLLVGAPGSRTQPAGWLRNLGCVCVEIDDPYAAMAELAARPLNYSSLVLGLNTLFREELQIIAAVKRRYPQIEIWLTRPEGRQAALDEAMALGADGFIAEDGLHRLPPPQRQEPPRNTLSPDMDCPLSEPVLTAEELRALLDDAPLPDQPVI